MSIIAAPSPTWRRRYGHIAVIKYGHEGADSTPLFAEALGECARALTAGFWIAQLNGAGRSRMVKSSRSVRLRIRRDAVRSLLEVLDEVGYDCKIAACIRAAP